MLSGYRDALVFLLVRLAPSALAGAVLGAAVMVLLNYYALAEEARFAGLSSVWQLPTMRLVAFVGAAIGAFVGAVIATWRRIATLFGAFSFAVIAVLLFSGFDPLLAAGPLVVAMVVYQWALGRASASYRARLIRGILIGAFGGPLGGVILLLVLWMVGWLGPPDGVAFPYYVVQTLLCSVAGVVAGAVAGLRGETAASLSDEKRVE